MAGNLIWTGKQVTIFRGVGKGVITESYSGQVFCRAFKNATIFHYFCNIMSKMAAATYLWLLSDKK
jgi:hypothetical protein